MKEKGWIKLHRKLLDCWIWKEKPFDKARAWIDLLLLANHSDTKLMVDNNLINVSRGSFFTSTIKLAERWGWSRNKVLRFLNVLECEQMLNTSRTRNGTIVTIVKYEDFQLGDTTDDTMLETTNGTTDDTTDGTQKKNVKNVKNNNIYNNILCRENSEPKNNEIYKEIIAYLNSVLGTRYKPSAVSTQKHINARLSEGRTLDDFKTVIDKKVAEWKGTEMERHLCPDTLFGTKFEKYLNQNIVERAKSDKPSYMANNPFLKHQQSGTDYATLEKELLGL